MYLRGRFEKSSVYHEKKALCPKGKDKDTLSCIIYPKNYILPFLFYLHEEHLSIASSSLKHLVHRVHDLLTAGRQEKQMLVMSV